MKTDNLTAKSANASLLAAFVASLCCITPVLALFSGIGGIAATFSWMEPFRPYMVGFTLLVLGFAWYLKLKPRTAEEIQCECEEDEKPSFWQSKKFLGIVTVVAGLLLAFPNYAQIFYPENNNQQVAQSSTINLAEFEIKGMTCSGCEEHVKHATNQLPGVLKASASFEQGTAQVTYDASILNIEILTDAINETGYTIVSSSVNTAPPEETVTNNFQWVELKIKGMTCSGCEEHVKHAAKQLPGVLEANASFAKGNAVVKFDKEFVSLDQVINAVNNTGYKVIDSEFIEEQEIEKQTPTTLIMNDDNISFYRVPLVCNAASHIGCGSRSKPVLLGLEKTDLVTEAWLNRAGNTIAVVWANKTNFADRQKVASQVFSAQKVKASMLMMEDYTEKLQSFESGNGWHRGSDVDKLSREEADIMADRIILTLKEQKKLKSAKDTKDLQKEIAGVWYDWFLNFESRKELGDPNAYLEKLENIIEIGEKYVGKGNMPDAETLLKSCSATNCNHQGCKSGSSCRVGKS